MSIDKVDPYWSKSVEVLADALGTGLRGLDHATAQGRLREHGPNLVGSAGRKHEGLRLFVSRFTSPLILILIFAALVALLVRDWLDAGIVLGIIFVSGVLSFIQEFRASNAVKKLRDRVSVKATVIRGGRACSILAEEVVPGDIVELAAGSLVPADGVLLSAKDFFVSQALLTGETFPVEKQCGPVAIDASLAARTNCVFMGTSVRSGKATALIVHTGRDTSYGEIAETLVLGPPETDFERGIRRFGGLLIRVMAVMVATVLATSIVLHRPTIETVLFAMALAVGLSPELLPAILTVTLAQGARMMAKRGVIVKRLNSIENLGSMDVLCTDKTGTLTKGVVLLDGALDLQGQSSELVLRLAFLNSSMQTGLDNPLDEAVTAAGAKSGIDLTGFRKLDEIPYDFQRKRLSIVAEDHERRAFLITKGALDNILDVCARSAGHGPLDEGVRREIESRFASWSEEGYRVLGVAQKEVPMGRTYGRDDESEMTFVGFLLFFDPPEPMVTSTLKALEQLGVQLKIITGDNRLVARHVATAVGIRLNRVITGSELIQMKDEALWQAAPETTLFAEVDPNQKERIIRALQRTGHVVGYLGDGINDAPALHAADVGISVDQAVDVAKEAADFVLLEHELEAVRRGVAQGRHTFANTLKYIFITMSANFGNMISMAIASSFLPFLPLLAKQILLNNFVSDIPAMGIARDNVDREWELTPHRWDIRVTRDFMLMFGLLSTSFDLLTFGALIYLAGETPELFRTGWFVESLTTQLLILLVIRTHKPFYRSRPGKFLLSTIALLVPLTVALPYLAVGRVFGFVPLPGGILAAVLGIAALYLAVSELTKRFFYRRVGESVLIRGVGDSN